MLEKLLRKGKVGFAESYMNGDFSTSNLKNLLIFAQQNESSYLDRKQGRLVYKLLGRINNYLNQNTKFKSQKNISYHYDLGNKFYELWLDASMNYSSGYFKLPYDDLSKAQLNKYQKIMNGEKIKFVSLKMPNLYQSTAFSFITEFPKELDIRQLVDYDLQFEGAFVSPLRFITDKIQWKIDSSYGTQGTLEDFFG